MYFSTITAGPALAARRYASAAFSAVVTPTVTPPPWLPLRGLTTTGGPSRENASIAPAASQTTMPGGTGTPASASSCLASTLSQAMSTPTAEVWSVSAAQTSLRWLP